MATYLIWLFYKICFKKPDFQEKNKDISSISVSNKKKKKTEREGG